MNSIISVVVVGLFFANFYHDVYWPTWCYLITACVVYITYRIRLGSFTVERLPMQMLIFTAYALIQGVLMFEWRPMTVDFAQMESLRLLAAHTTFDGIVLLITFALCWTELRKPIGYGLLIGGAIHGTILILDETILGKKSGHAMIGLLGNQSIGATFSAIWMFFGVHFVSSIIRNRAKKWCICGVLAIGFLSIIVGGSAISFVGFLAGCAAYLFLRLRYFVERLTVLIIGIGMIPIGIFIKGPMFFSHISRYDAWPMFYEHLDPRINLWIGGGAGSFKHYGPESQQIRHFLDDGKQWWLFTHNDWLQLVFEYGWIGLGLALLIYGTMLIRTYERPALFSALITFGVVSIGNYSLHIATPSLLLWWVAMESIGRDQR